MSQFSEAGDKKTLADFLKGIKKDVYPVGRLDYDSEGLLFLTNDKQLNHRLLHPLFIHEREYWVQVEGIPDDASLETLRKGTLINIDGKPYHTRPAKVISMKEEPAVPLRNPPIRYRASIPVSWLSLTLTEGKNRQVRRMTASVQLPTLRLIRHRIGSITTGDLQPGEYRKVNPDMIQRLFDKQ